MKFISDQYLHSSPALLDDLGLPAKFWSTVSLQWGSAPQAPEKCMFHSYNWLNASVFQIRGNWPLRGSIGYLYPSQYLQNEDTKKLCTYESTRPWIEHWHWQKKSGYNKYIMRSLMSYLPLGHRAVTIICCQRIIRVFEKSPPFQAWVHSPVL